nr:PrsW family intramembrane metalloprotease [Lachnospiraceae bacterium]
ILLGISSALFISEVNGLFLNYYKGDIIFVTTTVTPITEEIIKALPILVFAFLFTDNREKLLTVSFAMGIGFALFENTYILIENVENITFPWALARGFSTALMHGLCTAAVGYGMSFVRKRRKLFYCGTFSLLMLSIIYHGIFNMLVQDSKLNIFGFLLPIVTYIPLVISVIRERLKINKKNKEKELTENRHWQN